MKVKLVYYEGVVFSELPNEWLSLDRIYLPPAKFPAIAQDPLAPQAIRNHCFEASGFEVIAGEVYKVLTEIE